MSRRLRIGLTLALVAVLAAGWLYLASRPKRIREVVDIRVDMVLKTEPPLLLPEVAAADGSRDLLEWPTLDLHFHHDERITYRDHPRDDAFLRDLLQRQADSCRDLADPMMASVVNLVLRCDRRAPWSGVQRVIDIAGDGAIQMKRIHAVVEVAGVAGEQTISLRSTLNRAHVLQNLDKRVRIEWGPRIELSAGADLLPVDDFVKANLEGFVESVPLVAVDGDVPAGEVIELLMRIRAAGCANVLFVNPELESLGEPVLELR